MKRFLITSCLITTAIAGFSQEKNDLEFTIYVDKPVQQIRNIGASGCWFSEEIGKTWPLTKKNRIAELLFSKQSDKNGQPKGIGLSAFRFNIGAGTTEQGDSSGIKEPAHRVECFLAPGGTYDWTKQPGYTWMLQQAKNYGVENLIAFVNSPPVQFTKDGLGYKLLKDGLSNLKEDKYNAYGDFLASVIAHYDHLNLHFNYISPVNEPQWDWTGKFGEAKQEGSPWQNNEIYDVVKAVDKSLSQQKLNTKILITEAGMLDHLYNKSVKNSRQIAAFWDINSPFYIGGLAHTTKYVEGHGYFTENGDSYMIKTRRSLKDTLQHYGPGLEYWQSEYSMLGNGYLEKDTGSRSAIDCALFLAKVIHHDFAVGNATAWHFWDSYEPGEADHNTRYYLIAMNRNRQTDTAHLYTVTKNLWALGHYSLFVRPGMSRIETDRNDGASDEDAAQQVMIIAFKTENGSTLVVNIINYTKADKAVRLILNGHNNFKSLHLVKHYVTSAKLGDDMKPYPVQNTKPDHSSVQLPARSINTFIFSK
jgi:O-glycosyl hydrolase